MVTNVTSLSRSGLADFLIQRVTAVILALYTICIVGFFVTAEPLNHERLREFFGSDLMQVWSTLAVLATIAHAWVGMWTIGTDYIQPHYFGSIATPARLLYQGGCILALFLYAVWSLQIFWSL